MNAIVWWGASLPDFIQRILDEHTAQSTIIVCLSKEDFLEQLLATSTNPSNEHGTPSGLLQQPSLRMLAISQDIRLMFCPDIPRLRAYLATCNCTKHPHSDPQSALTPSSTGVIVLLNPLELHRPTSAFSAQGLNCTFSLAIEAAHRSGSTLVLAESNTARTTDIVTGNEPSLPHPDPWDEEVSIFNVTTKSFGPGGRGWVGRTVKIRQIAERWCRFEDPVVEA